MRRRCNHPGRLPGCLFDQAVGALRARDRAAQSVWEMTQKQLDKSHEEES